MDGTSFSARAWIRAWEDLGGRAWTLTTWPGSRPCLALAYPASTPAAFALESELDGDPGKRNAVTAALAERTLARTGA